MQQVNRAIEKFIKRVKKIALTILVFQFVSKAFRTMIEGIKTGIQNYARYSEQFNQKMSEMKSATLNLKNSIGAAAIPIVNALACLLYTSGSLMGYTTYDFYKEKYYGDSIGEDVYKRQL